MVLYPLLIYSGCIRIQYKISLLKRFAAKPIYSVQMPLKLLKEDIYSRS